MVYVVLSSPGKVSTPVTATAPTPAVGELSDFSTREVLGRSCRALLEHIQPQIPTLQAQPVGEEVGLLPLLGVVSLPRGPAACLSAD